MNKLEILHYPDERLKTQASPVLSSEINEELLGFAQNLAYTMYSSQGIGLAATQVNVHKQIIVTDVSNNKSGLLTLINPKIVASSGEIEVEEGCLSVPDILAKVNRAEKISVDALNLKGNKFSIEAEGLLAVCIQHEIDHLRGIVFVDYLSRLKQERVRRKMVKFKRALG